MRLVVPFAPGGGTDLIARTLGARHVEGTGPAVIIDNKPGAGTIIGTDVVAKSAPDGYTLVMATFAHAVNPSLQPKLPFDTEKAFAPVILIGRGPNVWSCARTARYKTRAGRHRGRQGEARQTDLRLARQRHVRAPGGRAVHQPRQGRDDSRAVPGRGPAITDLLGGQVDMIFGTAAAVATFVDSGKLRALGVTTR